MVRRNTTVDNEEDEIVEDYIRTQELKDINDPVVTNFYVRIACFVFAIGKSVFYFAGLAALVPLIILEIGEWGGDSVSDFSLYFFIGVNVVHCSIALAVISRKIDTFVLIITGISLASNITWVVIDYVALYATANKVATVGVVPTYYYQNFANDRNFPCTVVGSNMDYPGCVVQQSLSDLNLNLIFILYFTDQIVLAGFDFVIFIIMGVIVGILTTNPDTLMKRLKSLSELRRNIIDR